MRLSPQDCEHEKWRRKSAENLTVPDRFMNIFMNLSLKSWMWTDRELSRTSVCFSTSHSSEEMDVSKIDFGGKNREFDVSESKWKKVKCHKWHFTFMKGPVNEIYRHLLVRKQIAWRTWSINPRKRQKSFSAGHQSLFHSETGVRMMEWWWK